MPIYKTYHIASALLSLLKLIKRNVNDRYNLDSIHLNKRNYKRFYGYQTNVSNKSKCFIDLSIQSKEICIK